jgi:hypothetical protein
MVKKIDKTKALGLVTQLCPLPACGLEHEVSPP